MPLVIRKVRNQPFFSVKNSETGVVHSHHTTKANAKKQVRLLNAIDHGFKMKGGMEHTGDTTDEEDIEPCMEAINIIRGTTYSSVRKNTLTNAISLLFNFYKRNGILFGTKTETCREILNPATRQAVFDRILSITPPRHGITPEIGMGKIQDLGNMADGHKRVGLGVGGIVSHGELKNFVKASYKKKKDADVEGYKLDRELSTKRSKVYTKDGKTVVTHAGTDSLTDWANNLLIPIGLHTKSSRYKEAKKVQEKANKKYGKENIETVSHSQSGHIANNLAKEGLTKKGQSTTLNPAILNPFDKHKGVHVIKSSGDIVSALTKADEVIKAKTFNPLKEHSPDILGGYCSKCRVGGVLPTTIPDIRRFSNWLQQNGKYTNYTKLELRLYLSQVIHNPIRLEPITSDIERLYEEYLVNM